MDDVSKFIAYVEYDSKYDLDYYDISTKDYEISTAIREICKSACKWNITKQILDEIHIEHPGRLCRMLSDLGPTIVRTLILRLRDRIRLYDVKKRKWIPKSILGSIEHKFVSTTSFTNSNPAKHEFDDKKPLIIELLNNFISKESTLDDTEVGILAQRLFQVFDEFMNEECRLKSLILMQISGGDIVQKQISDLHQEIGYLRQEVESLSEKLEKLHSEKKSQSNSAN